MIPTALPAARPMAILCPRSAMNAFPFVAALAVACAQEPKPLPKPQQPEVSESDTRKLAEAMQKQFAAEGIAVDAKARTVTIKAVMNQPPDPIEYFLIHKRGKRHEALFITGSKPSVLNTAMLLIGLQPGKNAGYKEKDPPPSIEEIEKGADPVIVTPPQGMEFWITVRWKDAAGKPVEFCAEDLLVDLQAQDVVQNDQWIYLGGRLAQLYKDEPEVYVADFEGNLVSVCYLSPDNHLATMRHERARDDENWWITKNCPEPGTEVEIVFWREKPALMVEREKRLLEEAKKQKADAGKDGKDDKDDEKAAKKDAPERPPAGGGR